MLRSLPASATASRWILSAVVAITLPMGCSGHAPYVAPTSPMPPDTILLSQMMQQLSAQPGFTETVLAQLDKGSKNGPALLTPKLVDTMRGMILGKDWAGLNRFPGWTMREINPTVRVAGHILGKSDRAETLADPAATKPATPAPSRDGASFIDLGPYPLDKTAAVDLDFPSTLPGFSTEGIVSELGAGVVRGDGPDPALAPLHSESARLAFLLNRLSLNSLSGAAPAIVSLRTASGPPLTATTPEQLIQALVATGHTVAVADARYFANFGHFHLGTPGSSARAQDVMMPFWVNTQFLVPGTSRPLLLPVSHTEYEWFIHGPHINAAVAFYFGIDGKAEFRTMDELNQPWVLGRHAHEYTGADALEVTRLSGRMALAYMRQHLARPALPFGGYYALGVCQDAVSAIEKKLTGRTTLFPNTADAALFDDPRDAEVNALLTAIPKDRSGRRPEPERIFGSLPTADLAAITIPGLSADLTAAEAAWRDGNLRHVRGRHFWIVRALEAFGLALAIGTVLFIRRRPRVPAAR